MSVNLKFEDINITKAQESDWDDICLLLESANLHTYLAEEDNYKDYYVCKQQNQVLSCFSLFQCVNLGIIVLFAVDSKYQKKGIGKKVVSLLPAIAKKLNIVKIFLTSWEAVPFWEKTAFKKVKQNEITDDYFIYFYEDVLKRNHETAHKREAFILNVK